MQEYGAGITEQEFKEGHCSESLRWHYIDIHNNFHKDCFGHSNNTEVDNSTT
jgi:hypothetical protein